MIAAFNSLLENFPQTKGAAEAHYWVGYAHFELKQYDKAIEPLSKARELDAGDYQQRATLRTILAYFNLQDSENLRSEIDLYLESKPEVGVPNQVLTWLGLDLYSDEDFEGAERFLGLATDPENPGLSKGEVWSHLGKARIELGKYEEAVAAIDHYLATLNKPSSKARALLDKSKAQLGQKDYDASLETAREGPRPRRSRAAPTPSSACNLGDVAMSRQQYDAAAREYIIISEIFLDPEITPRAMGQGHRRPRRSRQPGQGRRHSRKLTDAVSRLRRGIGWVSRDAIKAPRRFSERPSAEVRIRGLPPLRTGYLRIRLRRIEASPNSAH